MTNAYSTFPEFQGISSNLFQACLKPVSPPPRMHCFPAVSCSKNVFSIHALNGGSSWPSVHRRRCGRKRGRAGRTPPEWHNDLSGLSSLRFVTFLVWTHCKWLKPCLQLVCSIHLGHTVGTKDTVQLRLMGMSLFLLLFGHNSMQWTNWNVDPMMSLVTSPHWAFYKHITEGRCLSMSTHYNTRYSQKSAAPYFTGRFYVLAQWQKHDKIFHQKTKVLTVWWRKRKSQSIQ